MIQRFHIEDLIAQDTSGVVFRALDTETGQPVAVRRFFPFGVDGGGLNAAEQPAYRRALGRLAGLSHPALRSVVAGGCDPVDGMPYIATEWIEGTPLQAFLAQGPLPVHVATELLTQVLEVCELLSSLLGEEALWVDTGLQTIIVGSPDSGRRFTFWICPLTWLGEVEKSCGLAALITLTENLLGWHDRPVSARAGGGLGGWLNWLRHAATGARLHEAREALATAMGAAPSYATRHLVVHPTRQQAQPSASHPAIGLWVVNLGLACVAAGLGSWLFIRQPASDAVTAVAAQALPDLELPAAVAVPRATPPPRDPPVVALPATPLATRARIEPPDAARSTRGAISWTSRELLVHNEAQEVVVEGVLAKIDFSGTKKTMYLLFSKIPGKNDARGAVACKTAAADLSESALTPLVGKKIRLRGTVNVQRSFGLQRPEILLKDRAALEIGD